MKKNNLIFVLNQCWNFNSERKITDYLLFFEFGQFYGSILVAWRFQEITKDEKQQVKTSKSVAQNGVEFSIYEENLREPALKSYENKLIKETSVALRETEKENATKDKEINNCSKSSARTVLQEINLTVLEQSKPLVNNKTDCQSTVQSEDFHSQTFKFDRSVLTELKSKKEPVKPRSDLFDVDVYRDDIYNYLRQAEVRLV